MVARRIREARKSRAMTMEDLAARCEDLGATDITYNVIVSLEYARRDPTVRQVYVVALALDVAPVHLLGLTEDGTESLTVTETVTVDDPITLQRWIRGLHALPFGDSRAYHAATIQRAPLPDSTLLPTEYGQLFLQQRAAELAAQFQTETANALAGAQAQVRNLVDQLRAEIAAGTDTDQLLTKLDTVRKSVTPDD
ncbi:hypothetical protein Pen01_40050 [Phytomonospora endophytica]|nr:hypothetical protein Pen01_40050 [Phytomonospora endophytica]